jgi:glutaredoxin
MKCISENAIMYSQTSCSHCITQKEILGDSKNLFNITECDKDLEKCNIAGITATPTWFIKDKKVEGVQSINQLKELTGC